ncbi:hypothetical protein C1645_790435 [Glomus cerebriforme]|uniref:Uncharacterized protein n=1 Tax=Glomus cerebriforme TaxID=658196 RepID=A0A397SFB5_9GLOM|nr:hypothetical protein C1645_790435 [Glomus cerebriforme]
MKPQTKSLFMNTSFISQNNAQISQTIASTISNENSFVMKSLVGCTNNNMQKCQRTQETLLSKYSKESFEINEYPFFYNPPNDPQIFHITCKEISFESGFQESNNPSPDGTIYVFYYQLPNDKFYKITCEIVSNSLIVQYLNKKNFGIELIQVEQQQEYLEFSSEQKRNLEYHLKYYLSDYLTPKRINNEKSSNFNMVKQENVMISSNAVNNNNTASIISQPQIKYWNKL